MGNSNMREGFKRTGSKRYSLRKPKEKSANLGIKKTMDESNAITTLRTEEKETTDKEMCVQNLKDHLKLHEENLDDFVEAQDKKIDGLLQLLIENTSENIDEESQEIILRQTKVMKSAVDELKDIQKNCQRPLNRIKDSFNDVRYDIERCFKVFETEQAANESAAVQIFYIYEGNVIKEIEKELKIMLKSKLGPVDIKHCPSATDIDQEKMLIVLCIVNTRLAADAAKAIKDVQNPGKAALLIIHITEAHTLPNRISSRHLTDQRFKNLRGILDMSFKTRNGFLQCEMNDRSLNELCLFCKQPPFGERL